MGPTAGPPGGQDGLEAHQYSSVEEADENQWNNLITQSAHGTIFHRYEWLRAVERGFDFEPRHAVVEKRGNPVAAMPNFARELPLPDRVARALPFPQPFREVTSAYPGYGGPVTVTDEGASLGLLFQTIERSAGPRDVSHHLRTPTLSFIRYGKYLQRRGYRPSFDTCLFFIDLADGWESIFDNMAKSRRRDVRRAREQDYRVEVGRMADEFDLTYDYYERNIERVGGRVLPRAFLEAISDGFGERLRVFSAVVEGGDVGRYVHILDEEASVMHHWLSAIPDESNYQYYPSELLHERAIKYGVEHGFDRYEFGPTGAHFSNTVFRFKEQYGGRPYPLFKMVKGYSSVVWPVYVYLRDAYAARVD